MMLTRTPMKRTAWNRAPKGQRNQPLPQEESAPEAIKTVAKFTRRGVIASVNDAVFAQPKEDVARSEKYRRLVAHLVCAHCGVEGYSQAAHGDFGKGLSIKADDRTCYPACAPHDGRQGCHYLIGTSGTYTREERRALDEQYGAQTRAKILDLGLWPANLPMWQEKK